MDQQGSEKPRTQEEWEEREKYLLGIMDKRNTKVADLTQQVFVLKSQLEAAKNKCNRVMRINFCVDSGIPGDY